MWVMIHTTVSAVPWVFLTLVDGSSQSQPSGISNVSGRCGMVALTHEPSGREAGIKRDVRVVPFII